MSRDLPIGLPVPGWTTRPRPPRAPLLGRFCRLEPLSPERHADALFDANALDREGWMFTYLFGGPYDSRAEYRAYMEKCSVSEDPLFFAIVDAGLERATGLGSYLRIEPVHGVIEVGHLAFSPLLQRTAAATEAMYLMMRRVFELGYRRYEWKCDALNAASRRAAERLGFTFEGIFRQASVYKGRNRDTAWYAIIDRDWPEIDAEFRRWLAPENFDGRGVQRTPLQNGVPKTSR
jgi:RimJ/RimL family protein N-acetyltransferase